MFGNIFVPYARVGERTLFVTALVEAAVFLLLWALSPLKFLPTPQAVWVALNDQIFHQGVLAELIVSMVLVVQALAIATVLALVLAYGYVMAFVRPLAGGTSGFRYLGVLGFSLVFQVLIKDAHWVKVAIVVFGILPYLTTSLVEMVRTIEDDQFQLARTMRLGHTGTTWHVIVRGRLAETIEVVRQNAAIGWMMVGVAESMNRSEGGIGARISELGRYYSQLPTMFALIMIIFIVGVLLDASLRLARDLVCPYAALRARSM